MDRVLSTHLLINHRLNTVWLDRIHEAGIPAVEIFCARQHFDYRDAAQVKELSYWFADSGLRLWSLHAPMYSDDCWGRTGPGAVVSLTERSKPRRLQSLDEIKRALDVAEEIPFRYLIQHLGGPGEEYDDRKVEAAMTSLEEISLFAHNRGVRVLLENIPNRLSTAERLRLFLATTHLDLGFCFDTGHANLDHGVAAAFHLMAGGIRSTHVHDNDGASDAHLAPLLDEGGTIDWRQTMGLFRSRPGQFPLVLELKESPRMANPIGAARQVFERLENL
jgi:sugar phosphate isomerase/epimerase